MEFAPTERCGFFLFSAEVSEDLYLVFQTSDEGSFNMKNAQNLLISENYSGVRQFANVYFNRPAIESGYMDQNGDLIKKKQSQGKIAQVFSAV